jgi:hypothetical protein
VPIALVRVELEIERVACAPLKEKVAGADVALANTPDAALVATTEQVVAALAVMAPRLIEHAALGFGSTKVTTPVPEPPAVVRVTDVPTGLLNVEFEIERVACAPMKLKLTGFEAA